MPKTNSSQCFMVLHTGGKTIEYTLVRKRVKNLNLRVTQGGKVVASAPLKMPIKQIEEFIASKATWIEKYVAKMQAKPPAQVCSHTKQECLEVFLPIIDEFFPLFEGVLKGKKPTLRVRDMKSRWGSCNIRTHVITLNMRLMLYPRKAWEYVVMHEYVHFLHPNHGEDFHAEMAKLMPDYKARRKMLHE